MGQKVHPEIFKLSRTLGWKSKHFEKKPIDTGSHIAKDVEVRKFVVQFFKIIGLNIFNCKLGYLGSKLNIFASYTKNDRLFDKGVALDPRKKPEIKLAKFRVRLRQKHMDKKPKLPRRWLRKSFKKLILLTLLSSVGKLAKYLKLKHSTGISQLVTMQDLLKSRLKELLNLNFFKAALKKVLFVAAISGKKTKKLRPRKTTGYCKYKIIDLFFKSFYLFFNKRLKITLILKYLNKNLKKARPKTNRLALKKKVSSLRRFSKNKFFKEGLNLMFLTASQKESAEVLASYIAASIKNFKKHKVFLKFVKKALYYLAKRRKTVIKSIKIQLKGRINGADRARSRVVRVGSRVSLLTLGSRINYAESTAFTPDGTLSVKVWMRYRKKLTEFKSKRCIKVTYANRATKNQVQKNKKR